jgi:hypothetical protein
MSDQSAQNWTILFDDFSDHTFTSPLLDVLSCGPNGGVLDAI